MGQFIQVDANRTVNSETITAIVLDGKSVIFFTSDGKNVTMDLPDNATALAYYTSVRAILPQLGGPPFITQIYRTTITFAFYDITVAGGGFQTGGVITVNAGACPTTILNSTTLSFQVPPTGVGTYDVIYTGPDGQVFNFPASLTVT